MKKAQTVRWPKVIQGEYVREIFLCTDNNNINNNNNNNDNNKKKKKKKKNSNNNIRVYKCFGSQIKGSIVQK